MILDKKPYNKKGERQGYWEIYFSDGQLCYRGNFINGKEHGHFLEYGDDFYYKYFYKNGERYYKNRCIKPLNIVTY